MSERLTDWLLLVAAIVASMVIFATLKEVARVFLVPFVIVVISLVVAKVVFGFTPEYLWHESIHFLRRLGLRMF